VRLSSAVLLVVPVLLAASGAGAAFAVAGGAPVGDGSHPFLAKLTIGTSRACTGALVDPQWVLTAKSCFAVAGQAVTDGPPPAATSAVVGRSHLSGTSGQELPVTEIVVRPDRDVALARLSLRTTGITPATIGAAGPAPGDVLRVAGYGRTADEWVPNRAHTARFAVQDVTPTTFGIIGHDPADASICKGDAGGPAWRDAAGSAQIVGINSASWQHGCLGETQTRQGAVEARVDDLGSWVGQATRPPCGYSAVYGGSGIGGFDLRVTADRVVPFDFASTGKLDHLLIYRPGVGTAYVVKKGAGNTFTRLYAGAGIGGFDLLSTADRVVPFDFAHTGKLDHLLVYRPGVGTAFVVKKGTGNTFTQVYVGDGIGGYDLRDPRDQVVAFDYDGTGRRDHLVVFRPGVGTVFVVMGAGSAFTRVFTGWSGIGGFDLLDTRDRMVAFDFAGTGRADHLLVYRPGVGTAYVVKREGSTFTRVYAGAGIGGFDLRSGLDQVVAFDHEHTGRLDHLLVFRPGVGTTFIVRGAAGNTFTRVYGGGGIGGYDMLHTADQAAAYDFEGAGSPLNLVVYRPGVGTAWVLGRAR
jgi:hypothetical protein